MMKKEEIHSVPHPFLYESFHADTSVPPQQTELERALASLLTHMYGLHQETLYYYWNIVEKDKIGLAGLFEKQCISLHALTESLTDHFQDLFPQSGSPASLFLPSFPENRKAVTSCHDMLHNIVKGHERCSQQALMALETADTLQDHKTSSLLLNIMVTHDKATWMIKALFA